MLPVLCSLFFTLQLSRARSKFQIKMRTIPFPSKTSTFEQEQMATARLESRRTAIDNYLQVSAKVARCVPAQTFCILAFVASCFFLCFSECKRNAMCACTCIPYSCLLHLRARRVVCVRASFILAFEFYIFFSRSFAFLFSLYGFFFCECSSSFLTHNQTLAGTLL